MACPDTSSPPPYPLPSGCAGSFPAPDPCCGAQLAAFPDLTVTIPDGTNANTYTAVWNGLAWGCVTGPVDLKFRMACHGGVMKIWVNADPGTTASAMTVHCSPPPLLFTFPGALFGSTENITVGL